jgi:TRAP-type C4-dicarboxylate transport system substrate-binding protein
MMKQIKFSPVVIIIAVVVFLMGGILLISCGPGEKPGEKAKKTTEPEKKPVVAKKKGPSLEKWKPNFDPSGAKYKFIVSNVSHPVIKGVYAGFAIRDALWERTNGQIYLDYKPFSMLGGEVEVLNQLQMGAIQGMACSSVASTNLGPRFGLINLPFLVNSFEKLDKFVASGDLFDHFMMAMDHQGIMGLDITGYGNYGWASTIPIKTIADAKKVKFRTAEAAVNQLLYKKWGFHPVVMPWPDVPIALKQGVITGLDHTPMVCNITKKFEVAKYFTQLNYAQGLFIWIFNKAWFNSLPADLQKTFKEVVREVCSKIRQESKQQEIDEIAKAKANGIQFFRLSDQEMAILKSQGDIVHKEYLDEINKLYPGDTYRPANYLEEVEGYMGYTP